jgi:hypothetical protein
MTIYGSEITRFVFSFAKDPNNWHNIVFKFALLILMRNSWKLRAKVEAKIMILMKNSTELESGGRKNDLYEIWMLVKVVPRKPKASKDETLFGTTLEKDLMRDHKHNFVFTLSLFFVVRCKFFFLT